MTESHHTRGFDSRLLSGIGTLAAVVEAGSFVRGAEALGLTQSGVSRAVARLEHRIGIRLFDRSARAVALTDEGRRFYEQVMPLLGGIEDAAAQAAGASAQVRGRLRVNVDPWIARFGLAPKLERFFALHPGLSMELVIRDRLGDLVAEGFDAAIRFGEPESTAVTAHRLLETRILAFAAPSYLEKRGRPLHPRELAGHECLMYRDPVSGQAFPWEFQRRGKVLTAPAAGRVLFNDLATKLAACVAGFGIAQSIELGLDELLSSGKLVQIFPDWAEELYPLYVFYPSRHLPPARVRAFVDFVARELRPLR